VALSSSIRLVTADATEGAATASARSLSSLAVDANAAAQAFESIDRLLRLHSSEPIEMGAESAPPQRSAFDHQNAEPMHAPKRSRFSVLGFLAGLALAAATGVLVYVYLPLP